MEKKSKTARRHKPTPKYVKDILDALKKTYRDAKCSLDFHDSYELITATILSAQCTDERVNKVTPAFFKKWPTVFDLASASIEDIEAMIMPTGFFRNKSKSLSLMAKQVVKEYNGKIPDKMEELVTLQGVGRKTANVVLGNCFGIPGITVDTHVTRLSKRMGLTKSDTQEAIEADLMKIIPQKEWTKFSHRMIAHGRAVCQARKPACEQCVLIDICAKNLT